MEKINKNIKRKGLLHISNCSALWKIFIRSNILKTYYSTRCRIKNLHGDAILPTRFHNTTLRCPRCCVLFSEGQTLYYIQCEKRINRFARRLLKAKDTKQLTKFQDNYLKKIKKNGGNKLVIICSICNNKVIQKLQKPKVATPVDETYITPKKKKKRKDRFSGLTASAVLSVSSTSLHSKNNFNQNSVVPLAQSQNRTPGSNTPFNKRKHESDTVNRKKHDIKKKKLLNNFFTDPKENKSSSVSLKHFLESMQ